MNNPFAPSSKTKSHLGKRKPSDNQGGAGESKKPRHETLSKLKPGARDALRNGEEVNGFVFSRGNPVVRHRSEVQVQVSQTQRVDDEQRIDEDVRQMEEESSRLRDVSLTHARRASGITVEVLSSASKPSLSETAQRFRDTTEPLPQVENPHNKKNKEYRLKEGRPHAAGSRGKRASCSMGNNGVITPPHPSVPTDHFHKYVDADLPDAMRYRQLLAFCCAARVVSQPATSTSMSRSSVSIAPPHMRHKGVEGVQQRISQLLAEGKFKTISAGGRPSRNVDEGAVITKEHDQNVKNRRREEKFLRDIERAKAEDAAWVELIRSYNARQQSIVPTIEPLSHPHSHKKSSKGKEKENNTLTPREAELGAEWESAIHLARDVLAKSAPRRHRENNPSPLSRRMEGIEFQVDQLHESVHIASQLALRTSIDLDKRFSRLSSALQFQSQPPPGTVRVDPREVLRAIAHVDSARPQGASEAARQAARELKRSETGGIEPQFTPLTPSTRRLGYTASRKQR